MMNKEEEVLKREYQEDLEWVRKYTPGKEGTFAQFIKNRKVARYFGSRCELEEIKVKYEE